jgi:hypothetical protein
MLSWTSALFFSLSRKPFNLLFTLLRRTTRARYPNVRQVARLGSVTFLVTHPHAGHPSRATHFNVNVFQWLRLFLLDWKPLIRLQREPRSIKVTEFEHRQITAVRKELDQEYEAQAGLKTELSKDAAPVKISSNLRT